MIQFYCLYMIGVFLPVIKYIWLSIENETPPLYKACDLGNVEVIELFIQHGRYMNTFDSLHKHSALQFPNVVAFLIEHSTTANQSYLYFSTLHVYIEKSVMDGNYEDYYEAEIEGEQDNDHKGKNLPLCEGN